jgi:hypothetical protein
MIVKIRGQGNYSFPGWVDGLDGQFMASDGRLNFSIDSNDSFIGVLRFGPPPPTCEFRATCTVITGYLNLSAAAHSYQLRNTNRQGSISDRLEMSPEPLISQHINFWPASISHELQATLNQ